VPGPEPAIDPRLAAALTAQLDRWRATLAAVGERLQPGDRLITGSVVQAPVRPGDRVTADLGPLGRVGLTIER
jgi:2-keto-4-pentenoate hydratase